MAFCGSSNFWDTNLTLNGSWPRFSQCFQSTALVYGPAAYLWVTSLFYLPYLLTRDTPTSAPNTRLSAVKTALSLVLVAVVAAESVKEVLRPSPALLIGFSDGETAETLSISNTAYYVSRVVAAVSFVLTALVVQLERRCQAIASMMLFIYWLVFLLSEIIPLYTFFELQVYSEDPLRFTGLLVSLVLVLAQLLLNSFADQRLFAYNRYSSGRDCPEVTASAPSLLTFSWLTQLIVTGYRRPLTSDDIWQLNPRDTTSRVLGRLTLAWRNYIFGKQKNPKGHSTWVSGSVSSSSSDDPWDSSSHNTAIETNGHSSNERSPLLGSRFGSSSGLKEEQQQQQQQQQQQLELKMLQSNRRSKVSLFKVLVRGFGFEVFMSYLFKAVSDCLQFTGPFLLRGLILHIEQEPDTPQWHGYVLAGAMLLSSWVQTMFYHQHYHLAMTSGMRMKAALMAAVYKKSLRVDTSGQRSSTSGEVVNLMSVDCQRIQDLLSYTWMVWSIPFQIFLAVYLLWDTLGYPVLSGLALLLLLVPLNAYVAYKQQKLQRQNLAWKDLRIKLIDEVLSGIKVLKLYAWEESFQDKILRVRQKEVGTLTRLAWLNALSIFVWTCVPYLVCLASFGTYVLVFPGLLLTADMAFVTIALFNILQFPISFIPEFVSYATQAFVSVRRLGKYLCETELDRSHYRTHDIDDTAVRIEKGTFTWNPDSSFRLSGIKLEIPKGAFVAVVGAVGSGKSSLLSAILGEMDRMQGKVSVSGSIAYVPQRAWIQNATVRDNILFGSSFIKRKYDKTISGCALKADLELLSGGDQTEIGEKGVNLSGGQKQRLSVARALYAGADVYLLDDPLSALDSHVGKHIFKRVLSEQGILKNQTRIMTTNAYHWLPLVDMIVVLNQGRITEVGSYLQLMKRDGHFAQFLLQHFRRDQEVLDSEADSDQEVIQMKRKMWEHVEALTSQSEGNTSGDDVIMFHQQSLQQMCPSNGSGSVTPTDENDRQVTHQGFSFTDRPPVQNDAGCVVRLTGEEATEAGAVKFSVFKAYCRNIGYFCTIMILLLFALYQVSSVLANIWLSVWTGDSELESGNLTKSEVEIQNTKYLTVYGILGGAQAFFVLVYACLAALRMVTASSQMHAKMLDSVLKSPMSFFDTTPTGRIVNRFSRDMETLDNQMPQVVFMFILCVFSVLATLVVISINTPIFTAVIVPLVISYWAVQRFFVPTSRQMKRLESVTRSPIFSHFSETLTGCHVIRAFGAVDRFVQTSTELIDKNQVFYFARITANRWLGVWIETVSSLVVFFSAVFSLVTPGVDGATLGLSVSYALQITQGLKWLVRTMSDIETNSVSIERVDEYSELPSEPPRITDSRPSQEWPDRGEIIFNNYSARYREGLDLVLKNLQLHIAPGEKIGVVGRTGAGKSSLAQALFRMLQPESGDIIVDNINIGAIGLYDLRSKITILPQDPVIMSGTLRSNVDPLGVCQDKDIWAALSMSHLLDVVSAWPAGLSTELGDTGLSLSSGQRQLVCLTRALLRKTKILILDEPTSSVDMETDTLVQSTVRRVFRDCTTITIAHRISTVLDCDRVMVLDKGGILELDRPQTLLDDEGSRFHKMARTDRALMG